MRRRTINLLALLVIATGALSLGARPARALDDEGPFVLNPDLGAGTGGGGSFPYCCSLPNCNCCGKNFAWCDRGIVAGSGGVCFCG